MPTNDFLIWDAAGTNIESQAAYAADSARTGGVGSGIASFTIYNKVTRQASAISAMIAAYIVQQTGQDALDDGTTATLLANFTAAVVDAGAAIPVTDTGTANAMVITLTPAPVSLAAMAGRLFLITKSATGNTAAVTLNPNGLGATAVTRPDGAALTSGFWPAAAAGLVYCTGTAFFLMGVPNSAQYAALNGSASNLFSVANGTSGNQAVNFGQFANGLAASGYQKMPGGLILQWTNGSVLSTGGVDGFSNQFQTVTLPTTFPNSCLQAFVSTHITTATITGDAVFQVYATSVSSVSIALQLVGGNSTGTTFVGSIFAIGW